MSRSSSILLVLLTASVLPGQISPGPLSQAHQHLGGATQCIACHTFGAGAPKFKCQNCHSEIAVRVRDNRGFHAGKTDCVKCHTDHFGKTFNIVKWETTPAEFDHRQAGYPLQGRHAGLACARCHNGRNVSAAGPPSVKVKDLNHTYLGLAPRCATCHNDVHKGQLGPECAKCHTGLQAWKPVAGFDHSTARFHLTGLHGRVACAGCHRDNQFRGVAFASCGDCHKDPHRGAFQGSCQSCHSTSGWKPARLTSSFDHGSTRFPLQGLHANTGCFKCHASSNFKEPVPHERCADCHRPDPHKGQFAGKDCAACHNETGFKPSLFTRPMHQKTAYPLQAKHASVACEKCHLPAGPDTVYKVRFDACNACHKDAHAGQFSGQKCEACHTIDAFRPSTFTLTRHQQSRFPLRDSHAAAACVECHKSPANRFPPPPAQFKFESLNCVTCHADPHQGQFQASKHECESCHNLKSWKETLSFDHSKTRFALAGAHRAVHCTQCHRPANLSASVRQVTFRDATAACQGCHEDIHRGQFQDTCSSCHAEVAWKPTTFDHETRSSFSLAGAHKAVACRQCHDRRTVVPYKGTPSKCSACHAGL
ncbi:MAG: hypothetical protein HYR60_07195 [Acidobacteria bacterium]|nr:hypothetical protein [Acidobacteriota bacterium]